MALGQRAYDTKRYALAARLWGEALESEPKLGDDRQKQHRYDAACAAALAGCGKGKDEPSLDDAAKAKLRDLARVWLTAELDAWTRLLETATPEQKQIIAQTLNHWRKVDPDLASIRDEAELSKLPESEQSAFRKLWTMVDELLERAGTKPDSEPKPAEEK